jgi:hypothetical protein
MIDYTIRVYCAQVWATGSHRGSYVCSLQVAEEPTILGGMRAIDRAVEQCKHPLCDVHPPEIEPNPVLMGWELGS